MVVTASHQRFAFLLVDKWSVADLFLLYFSFVLALEIDANLKVAHSHWFICQGEYQPFFYEIPALSSLRVGKLNMILLTSLC